MATDLDGCTKTRHGRMAQNDALNRLRQSGAEQRGGQQQQKQHQQQPNSKDGHELSELPNVNNGNMVLYDDNHNNNKTEPHHPSIFSVAILSPKIQKHLVVLEYSQINKI
ncbi:hypothetical protein RRG08_039517 [Elysia crispata]|uniref:Uncharacterized protein n=1 Tax=Elysia crispata TaxID=231223 RepID=A0AAE0YJS4_9GAST|nr:hypothetical protein RRG08_039517 [Elysia crispata]